jgi:predicted dienelactone hydrolase
MSKRVSIEMKRVSIGIERVLLGVFLVGCGSSSSSKPQSPTFEAEGQYGIGVHTFTFVDSSRPTPANNDYKGAPDRTLVTEFWYPSTNPPMTGLVATKDAPAMAGSFPLIVHSHGFMDSRVGENYLARHLASHGYLVAAPDYPLSNSAAPGGATVIDLPNQPGDLSFVIDQLLADPAWKNAVDSGHIGISGLSLGGLTTLLSAFHSRLRDPRVKAAMALAPVSCMLTAPFFAQSVPLMMVQGDRDMILPIEDNSERAFPLAKDPRELVVLKTASHTGFSGFASLFDPTMNYDRIGCMAIGSVQVMSFSGLGTADEGIAQDASVCAQPCQQPIVDPSLEAGRQQQLTQAIGLAFFESKLRGDGAAEKFLEGPLQSENSEVTLRLK